MSVRDQIADGLSNMNSRWKLSCFSIAESVPEGQSFEPRQKNEVLGDVSFEEVRWVDYQEPNKQACVQRFAQANRLKSAQFQVGLRANTQHTAGNDQKLLHHQRRLQGHLQLLSAGLHLRMDYVIVIQLWMCANCISNTAFMVTNDHIRCCQAGIHCRCEPITSLIALQIGQPFIAAGTVANAKTSIAGRPAPP